MPVARINEKGQRLKVKGERGKDGKRDGWAAGKLGGGKAAPSAALGVRGEERACP